MEAEPRDKKPRKRKKSRTSISAADTTVTASSSLHNDGDGNGAGKQQQLHRGKPRVVWTPELHGKFLKAYNTLGEDAVPKKILALMNVDWISRENVASHLQKHRLSLKVKREEQRRIPGKVNQQPPHHAEASSPTPTHVHVPSLHPPAQAPASSSLHPLPPSQQASFTALTMSRLQIGHGHQHHLVQTPPDYCLSSSSNAAPTSLLLHPHPCFIPTVQPIQQLFTLPLDLEDTTVATRRKLFEKQQEVARLEATMAQRAAAAAASGYNNNLMLVRNDVAKASQSVSMTGESLVPEANVRYEAAGIRIEHLQMTAEGEEGQAGRAAEPRTAAAGSSSPHGSSIHEQYWKIDDITDVSWDFCGTPCHKTS